MNGSLHFYAPNAHTGGGLVLLRSLLLEWPSDLSCKLYLYLDMRAKNKLELPSEATVAWISPTLISRFRGELTLAANSQQGDIIFCFHGIPPLFAKGKVIVFHQNRLLLDATIKGFRLKTAFRLALERKINFFLRYKVSSYIVQTPSMATALKRWHKIALSKIHIFPFMSSVSYKQNDLIKKWDFVYVADGEAHKNHLILLEAWRLLAEENIKPRIALTLCSRDSALINKVDELRIQSGINIYNLGYLPPEQVFDLYLESRALIFPSLIESFGLPLIEAQQLGLPILAPELDYVRDVCKPVETFDPRSPFSIARAVKRFLCIKDTVLKINSSGDFITALTKLQ